MKVVALVPLRGGSKSIPKKNIKNIAGKPLCNWVLDAALKSKKIDEVYVSTDSDDIKDIAVNFNDKIIVIKRPAELSGDKNTTEEAMLHFAGQVDFDLLVTIQATSPLITAKDLDHAIADYFSGQYDTMLTAVPWKRFFWKKDGTPINYDHMKRPMRQDFESWYMETGSFYITSRIGLLKHKNRLFGNIGIYELPPENAIEIDEPEDWEMVANLLEKRNTVMTNTERKLRGIKLLVLDVDGVLTDSGMYYSADGEQLKKFSTRDGQGISLLREAGVKCAIITSENSEIARRRAEKLNMDYIFIGRRDKLNALNEILNKEEMAVEEVAYIGDDIYDIPVLKQVGFSSVPGDGHDSAKAVAGYICEHKGGQGCVREVCDIIIKSKR